MVHRPFSELSTAVCGAIARLHLKYAMEDNSLNLGANTYHLEWVQRLAKRHVPYVEWLHQLNHASKLAFKIFKDVIALSPSDFFLRPPRAGLRGHTYSLLQGQIAGVSSHVTLNFYFFRKKLGRQCFRIFLGATV